TADRIVGGLQVGFIVLARSGYPFTVVDGSSNGVRATQVGDPFANTNGTGGRYLNPLAFSKADLIVRNVANTTIRFGSLGRNTFNGPRIVRTDMSVVKNTGITERIKLQLGFDFNNLFNSSIYTVPNNDINNFNFETRTGDFGKFESAFPGRVVQFKGKLLF
ncbi:MAG TPA: hypothetical protein VF762_20820, partial [Blastocatellia bacterium]